MGAPGGRACCSSRCGPSSASKLPPVLSSGACRAVFRRGSVVVLQGGTGPASVRDVLSVLAVGRGRGRRRRLTLPLGARVGQERGFANLAEVSPASTASSLPPTPPLRAPSGRLHPPRARLPCALCGAPVPRRRSQAGRTPERAARHARRVGGGGDCRPLSCGRHICVAWSGHPVVTSFACLPAVLWRGSCLAARNAAAGLCRRSAVSEVGASPVPLLKVFAG